MSTAIAIEVKDLSKKYRLKHPVKDDSGQTIYEHHALRNVSVEIMKGEAVGIIGPNGSGKSTLLKILSGISKPSSGTVITRGRVASILDIGAGFHQELSGRENVFLNGQLLGFTYREIKAQYEHIVAFSGIGTFIEEPVKNYSNGMYLRLAFSILAHLNFDIYLFDEVMNVGDASFQIKVKQFLQQKMQQATCIFVSHQLAEIQSLCSTIYLLDNGVIRKDEPGEIIEEYISESFNREEQKLPLNKMRFAGAEVSENSFVELQEVYVDPTDGMGVSESGAMTFTAQLKMKNTCRADISFGVESLLGTELLYVSTLFDRTSMGDMSLGPGVHMIKTQIPAYTLKKGKYVLTITIIADEKPIVDRYKACYFQIVNKGSSGNKQIDLRPHVVIVRGNWSATGESVREK